MPLVGVGGTRTLTRDGRPFLRQFGIQTDKFFLTGRDVIFMVDSFFWAFRDANGAIDTLIGVDNQEVRADSEAVDRADGHTGRIGAVDARFTNDVSQGDSPQVLKGPESLIVLQIV